MCHVPGPRGNSLGYFRPSRVSSQCFSQAPGASRSQHRLSSFLLTKDGSPGCNAARIVDAIYSSSSASNLHHTYRHHITSASLFRRSGILDIESYFHNRIPRWAGHVARMPMSRAPGQLLTGLVSHSRPIGCPQMTWGRTLENALKSKGIPKNFDDLIAIAKDRSKWRQLTHSIPKPPDAWRLKDTSRENDYNCIMQKDT